MKVLPPSVAALACLAAALTAHAQYQVYAGGTTSTDGQGGSASVAWGYGDMAIPSFSTKFRAAGGKFYCHSYGWSKSSTTIRNGVYALFGSKDFILESAVDANSYTTPADDMQRLFKGPGYWSSAGYIVINFVEKWTNTSYPSLLKTSLHPFNTSKFAPIWAPNSGFPASIGYDFYHPDLHPWATDPLFAILRNTATVGGTLCTDAPPQFYFDVAAANPDYQQYVADEIRWANDNGLVSIAILFPRDYTGPEFLQKTGEYLEDLAKRGAIPQILAFNAYNGSISPGRIPIGSENDINTMMYTARVFAERALLVGKTISLRAAANGRFVSADLRDPKVALIANRGTVGNGERFVVVDAGKGLIALRAMANSKYVTSGAQDSLKASKTSIGSQEKFRVRLNADGTISLLHAYNGRYASTAATGNEPLHCDQATAGIGERFAVAAKNSRPTVRITKHKVHGRWLRLVGQAQDDSRVDRIEIIVNGKRRKVSGTKSFSTKLPVKIGRNRIIVRAFDDTGNVSVPKILIVKRNRR